MSVTPRASTSRTTAPPSPPVVPEIAIAATLCASVKVKVKVVASVSVGATDNVTSSVPVALFKWNFVASVALASTVSLSVTTKTPVL